MSTAVTLRSNQFQVNLTSDNPRVINLVKQGPPGASAGDETPALVTYTAGATMSGNRMVVLNDDGEAIYADRSELAHINKVLGMTTGAATDGSEVNIQTYGAITEAGWSWTLDQPIFLSTTGALTQVKPTAGFLLVVGFPLTATSLFLDIKSPVLL